MTSHETAIAERLREAAGRVPVDTSAMPTLEAGGTRVARRSSLRRPTVIAGVAAAVLASTAALVAFVVLVGSRPTSETVTTATTATAQTPTACEPSAGEPRPCSPALAPHVASPPAWFGEPQGAFRTGGLRSGEWVSMAIGRVSADAVSEPIVVSVFDGTYEPLDNAERVTIGGAPLRSVRFQDWQALATDGTPTVMAIGHVDADTLSAVIDAVEVSHPSGELSLRLRSLPDGYTEIVPARPLGTDYEHHRTLGSESGDVGINEVSDWTDPLLSAASTAPDLAAVDVGAHTGWIGRTTANPAGPLQFLVWSPRPGVVFEITTHDMQRTPEDLVDLALATSAIGADDWDAIYGD